MAEVTHLDCGHVAIEEIKHHDCSLGGVRVDVYKAEGRPVFVNIEVEQPTHAHSLTVPDLDDVVAVFQEARKAAADALAERGIRS